MTSKKLRHLESLSAIELADIFLLLMIRRHYSILALEPRKDVHVLKFEPGFDSDSFSLLKDVSEKPLIELPVSLADAVIVRLSLLASIDIAAPDNQLGKIILQVDNQTAELLLSVRAKEWGLTAELQRIALKTSSVSVNGGSLHRIEAYKILEKIGQGAMGKVYRAEHKSLKRPVAIKVLHSHKIKETTTVERFIREARAASRINDPGVVQVLDFGILPGGQAFLVMELVHGNSLRGYLEEEGPLSPLTAVQFGHQVARALQAVHKSGIVHRDLKPANIFIDAQNQLKIGDFGAAKDILPETPDLTQPGVIYGTPLYMSPEQARGLALDQRSDIYSFGCAFYEMLSGTPPFRGDNPFDILVQHIRTPIPKLESPYAPFPRQVEQILEKSLEKDLDHRYQNATELCADLERAEITLSRYGWRRWLPKPI